MTPNTILDRGFNCAVLHIASRLFPTGYDISDNAPETYDELCAHVASTGRMLVWSGASDRTIFGDNEVNYAFRAWHDHCHLRGSGHDFSWSGEHAVLQEQQSDIVALYGHGAKTHENGYEYAAILDAEVIGQLYHKEIHGRFPCDQIGFVRALLAWGDGVTANAW